MERSAIQGRHDNSEHAWYADDYSGELLYLCACNVVTS